MTKDREALSVERTERGFALVSFSDVNGVQCSLQKSSLATEDAIWLGANEIGLRHFQAGTGWSDVPTPHTVSDHFVANTRMHLTRDQVAALLPALNRFAETGELDAAPSTSAPDTVSGMVVKPLEWVAEHDEKFLRAVTPFGGYWVKFNGSTWDMIANGAWRLTVDSRDEAKSAAQADYDQRIRSALAHTGQAGEGGEPLFSTFDAAGNLVPVPRDIADFIEVLMDDIADKDYSSEQLIARALIEDRRLASPPSSGPTKDEIARLVAERDEAREERDALKCELKEAHDTLAEQEAETKVSEPAWTYGHCEHKRAPGGCQLHNLQCAYPDCDRRPAAALPPLPNAVEEK